MKILFWVGLGFVFFVVASLIYFKYATRHSVYHGSYVHHGKIKLWTESFGNSNNPPLILISGAMAPARLWSDTFCSQIVQQGFFVIRYDQRDTGLSSGVIYENAPYDLKDLVADSIAILDHFKIEKAYAAGISMGGSIAQLFALQNHDRCAGIILISSPTPSVELSIKEEKKLKETWRVFRENKPTLNFGESFPGFLKSYKYLNGTIHADESMIKQYVKDMYERTNFFYKTKHGQIKAFEDPHNHVRAQMHGNVTVDNLKGITVPALIIHGEKDPVVFPIHALTAKKHIRQSQLLILKDMGHMIFNRNLENKVAHMITRFLAGVRVFGP